MWLSLVRSEHIRAVREELSDKKFSAYRVGEKRVPKDHVFVVGDNVLQSEDSRDFGPIPISAIVGRAVGVESDTSATAQYEWQLREQRSSTYRQALHEAPADRG